MRYLFMLVFALGASACGDYDELQSAPVLMSRSDVEASVKLEASRPLKAVGATAVYKHAIYIAEHYEGIHVVDNSNPSAPVKTGFIRVPGIWHIAIIDGRLITDNSCDILSFELSNPLTPRLQARAQGLLMPPPSPYNPSYWSNSSDTLIVGYRDTVVRQKGGMM